MIIQVEKHNLNRLSNFLLNYETTKNPFLRDSCRYIFFKQMTEEEVKIERNKRIEEYKKETIKQELETLARLKQKYEC